VVHPVFKTGGARQTALEGSTPSPLRMTEQDRLRELPSVDRLATAVARAELDARRAQLLDGATDDVDLVAGARDRLRPRLRRVLNATGVIVHTNLGRAPLAAQAQAAVARAAAGYSNLELDLVSGERGSRHDHVEGVLQELTGAEAAIVVNNCAAAVLLAAAALAGGREIVVSRGQLIEIGGGFRIPEILTLAGTRLVEVGTTNRTRRGDYEAALTLGGEQVGAILRAHPSNFRTVGFVEEVEIEELCGLGATVIDDVGSGVLAEEMELLAGEPAVRRSVRAGAALVVFSGDKLLGGPQAGVLVGGRAAIDACRCHPLARAVRIDKLSLAALEATLALYRDPARARRDVPVLAMLGATTETLRRRARALCDELAAFSTRVEVVESEASVGGGAFPSARIPSVALAISGDAGAIESGLRLGEPAVIGRVSEGRLLLDLRTVAPRDDRVLGGALLAVMRSPS
jgi:L-seryl-tRNA(Ser) seleniumtransferase